MRKSAFASWLVLFLALAPGMAARAASLFFEAVPIAGTDGCLSGCFSLRIFFEDPSRSLRMKEFQLDLDLTGASPLGLPAPGGSRDAGANTTLSDFEGNSLVSFPWDLLHRVGFSTTDGFDVLLVDNVVFPFTLDEFRARHEYFDAECVSSCLVQRQGIEADRVFLGRFNIAWHGGPVDVRVGITPTLYPATQDPIEGILRLDGARFDVAGLPAMVPEASVCPLLGALVVAAGVRRRLGRESRAATRVLGSPRSG